MALTEVKMSEEVWLTCLTHALSTETEEIMGLLLGDVEDRHETKPETLQGSIHQFHKVRSYKPLHVKHLTQLLLQYMKDGRVVALIWGAAPQTRSDRRKDRVETNPEQLAAASALADKMTGEIGKTTRVIGWYHSHPHITVMPSHVDVKTQAMYQMLDPGFVGLIFSCFSEDANKVGRIQVLAFQSLHGQGRNVSTAVGPAADFTDVDSARAHPGSHIPSTSEVSSGQGQHGALENLFAMADSETRAEESKTLVSEDESLSMQEAMHLSKIEASGAEFVRKEIPLDVVPSHTLAPVKIPLAPLVELQRVLFQEEKTAYMQAIAQSTKNGHIHPLAFIHHSATYEATLSKLMEYCLFPVVNGLSDKLYQNKLRLKQLQEETQAMELENMSFSSGPSSSSPQSVREVSFQGGFGHPVPVDKEPTPRPLDMHEPQSTRGTTSGRISTAKPNTEPDLIQF